jgi:hypothetical protein
MPGGGDFKNAERPTCSNCCAITPADAIGEAFCEERERLGLAKALTTDVGRVGLKCFDYELTCQKVGRTAAAWRCAKGRRPQIS